MSKSQPKVTECLLDSGIRVFVIPLSRHQRNALNQAAEKLYPYPDKKQYEETLPEDVAIPGMTLPAEENKDYQVAVREVNRQRSDYIGLALLDICVSYPDFPGGKDDLMKHFAPFLEKQRDWMALPEDEWEATLRFGILQSIADELTISRIANEETPVTEVEVNEEMRIFRPAVQVAAAKLLDSTRQHPPGAKTESESQSQ